MTDKRGVLRMQLGHRAGWVMACLLNLWAPSPAPSLSLPREAAIEGFAVPAERDPGAACPAFDDVSLMYSAMRTVAASIAGSHPQPEASARVLSLARIVHQGTCVPLRWGPCTGNVGARVRPSALYFSCMPMRALSASVRL